MAIGWQTTARGSTPCNTTLIRQIPTEFITYLVGILCNIRAQVMF